MKHRVEIEMTIGGILIAAGLTLVLALPPPWLPEMGSNLLHLGMGLGGTFLLVGIALVIVASSRTSTTTSPRRFVRWWDSVSAFYKAFGAVVILAVVAVSASALPAAEPQGRAAKAQQSQPCFGGTWNGIHVEDHDVGFDLPSCFNGKVTDYTFKSHLPAGADHSKAVIVRDPPSPHVR
jgi:hypothetical protein